MAQAAQSWHIWIYEIGADHRIALTNQSEVPPMRRRPGIREVTHIQVHGFGADDALARAAQGYGNELPWPGVAASALRPRGPRAGVQPATERAPNQLSAEDPMIAMLAGLPRVLVGWAGMTDGERADFLKDWDRAVADLKRRLGRIPEPRPARPPYTFQSTCSVCGTTIGGDGDVCSRCAK